MKTALCKHEDGKFCVWCVGTHEPTIEEVIECMEGEFK
jgi:hypothetical protein